MLLALSLDLGLGLNLNNGVLANFHLVYIFTIETYFVTASLERIVDLAKGKSSLFGQPSGASSAAGPDLTSYL